MLDENADLVVQDRMRFRVRCADPHGTVGSMLRYQQSSLLRSTLSVLEGVALETSGARTPARVNVSSRYYY